MSPDLIKQLLISAKMIQFHEGMIGVEDIEGVNAITEICKHNATHIEFSISLVETDTEQIIYVIIPGSNDKKDWLANFKFRLQDMIYKATELAPPIQAQGIMDLLDVFKDIGLCIPHADKEDSERWSEQRVHTGFLQSYYGIQKNALADFKQALTDYPDAKIYGTAHSLGSAVLRFLFLDAQFNGYFGENREPSLHTYGAPRMGNAAFTQSLKKRLPNITRVVHANDLVTRLPLPLIGYRHETEQLHIGNRGFLRWYYKDDMKDHYLKAYVERLNQLLAKS